MKRGLAFAVFRLTSCLISLIIKKKRHMFPYGDCNKTFFYFIQFIQILNAS